MIYLYFLTSYKKIVEAHMAKALSVLDEAVLHNAADKYLLYNELEKVINATLERLDADSVAAFKMSRWEGRKYDEIAEIMQVSRRTIEVRVTKIVRELRAELVRLFPFLDK